MKNIIELLNNNSGAITAMATLIYTVATIVIMVANYISAKAANKQIMVSNEQYDDSKHLQIMPFLQASFSTTKAPSYDLFFRLGGDIKSKESKTVSFLLENVGKGAAINLSCIWTYCNSSQNEKMGMTVIHEGAAYKIDMHLIGELLSGNNNAFLTIKFSDLLGKYYTQKIVIQLMLEGHDPDEIYIQTSIPVPV